MNTITSQCGSVNPPISISRIKNRSNSTAGQRNSHKLAVGRVEIRKVRIARKLSETKWVIIKRCDGNCTDVCCIRLIIVDPNEECIARASGGPIRFLLEILLQD